MRKLAFISIILLFLVPISVQANFEKDRVLIQFKGSIDYDFLNNREIVVHHVFENFSIASVTVPTNHLEELEQNVNIINIEKDTKIETSGQIIDWGYKAVEAAEAKKAEWTGKGIKIGIIDTGINLNHPDLAVAGGVSFVQGVPSYNDDDGHGTHVAGIIGAQDNNIGTVGIAPDAEIYAIKSLNNSGIGYFSDVIAGIQWAVNKKMDIINLSLTSEEGNSYLERAVNYAYENGVLVIAAAGNSKHELFSGVDVLFPARYSNVIAVGSVDAQKQKSKFSYIGPSLEFVAPGENIYSTYTTQEYLRQDGTSMASPFVAGIAALYKQAYPELNHKEIRQLMHDEALDLGKKGRDTFYGYGFIQAPSLKRSFLDVPSSSWYFEEIEYLFHNNIITGYENHKFLPNNWVTRAEAVTMISRALGYDETQTETRYKDVSKTLYASGFIEKASEQGIVKGFPTGEFKPNASIIRGDVAALIQRAYEFEVINKVSFLDVDERKYYFSAINALSDNQIMMGYPDNRFKPNQPITRAEFAVMLARVLNEGFRK